MQFLLEVTKLLNQVDLGVSFFGYLPSQGINTSPAPPRPSTMLPFFHRKKASLKQDFVPISEDWQEIGETLLAGESPVELASIAIDVAAETAERIEPVIETAPVKYQEVTEFEQVFSDKNPVIESWIRSDHLSDLKVLCARADSIAANIAPTMKSDETSLEFQSHCIDEHRSSSYNNFQLKLDELNDKLNKLQIQLDKMEQLKRECPVCAGNATIVIDVSRLLDLMRDIFTTGMQYQQRVANRVCDELCQFAGE
jgi:hypothetical protein